MTDNRISPAELQHRLVSGERLQVIDVRSAREFDEGHIPGAQNIPMEQVETRLDDLRKADPIVLVCQSGRRAGLCHELLERHHDDLIVLHGGTADWVSSGLPVVKTTVNRLSLMRQVQIGAGVLILTGSVLGYFIDVRWLVLSAFVGAGLLTAGTTGFCLMAVLLEKMPWNRAGRATRPTRQAVSQ